MSKRMHTNLTASRSKKKYHPISTDPKIGVRGGGSYCAPTVKVNFDNLKFECFERFLVGLIWPCW